MTEKEIYKMYYLSRDLDLVKKMIKRNKEDHESIGFTIGDYDYGGFRTDYFKERLIDFLYSCKNEMEDFLEDTRIEISKEFKGE